jgi:hypothetical protein
LDKLADDTADKEGEDKSEDERCTADIPYSSGWTSGEGSVVGATGGEASNDGRRGVNCTAYLLWHLDDEVEEKSCKAELHPRQSVDRTQSVCVGATTYSEEMQGFVIDG